MQINNFFNSQNIKFSPAMGCFQIAEHQADLSITPQEAVSAYFSTAMNVKKRQVVATIDQNHSIILSAGAMQWMAGDVNVNTGVKGVGDFLSKSLGAAATGEDTVKPVYYGNGIVCLEPTYKHIIIDDIKNWGGAIVMDDGLFLACEASLTQRVYRKNFAAGMASGQRMDFFNFALQGNEGMIVLESPVAQQELVEIYLQNETIKVDGDLVIAWSPSVNLTVEPVQRRRGLGGLVGSAATGEGLVNTFSGTGKVLLAPTL